MNLLAADTMAQNKSEYKGIPITFSTYLSSLKKKLMV